MKMSRRRNCLSRRDCSSLSGAANNNKSAIASAIEVVPLYPLLHFYEINQKMSTYRLAEIPRAACRVVYQVEVVDIGRF